MTNASKLTIMLNDLHMGADDETLLVVHKAKNWGEKTKVSLSALTVAYGIFLPDDDDLSTHTRVTALGQQDSSTS